MTTHSGPEAVRFGPRESQGWLLGLRWPQLFLIGIAALCVIALLNSSAWGGRIGFLFTIGFVLLVAFLPVRGRKVDQYVPIIVNHLSRRLTNQHIYRGGVFRMAATETGPTLRLPGELSAVEFQTFAVGHEVEGVCVVKDRRAGTYTAVLALEGDTFALLESGDQARRIHAWGGMLTRLCGTDSAITRIHVLERTIPDSGDSLIRDWRRRGLSDNSWQAQAYLELIEAVGPRGQRHETFLAVTLSPGKASRRIRAAGGRDLGAATVLFQELDKIAGDLRGAGISVLGWLPERALAYVLRTAFDPASTAMLDRRGGGALDRAGGDGGLPSGVDPRAAGPMRMESHWDHLRTDSAVHRTYWIMEWPRREVPAGFLSPLLLETNCRRAVSLVMEPIPPSRASRMIETRQTTATGEEAARRRIGRRITRRQQTEASDIDRRESELVNGYGLYRTVGFVTVSAADMAELELSCGEVESAAQRSNVELTTLVGEQDQGFLAAALPLARGLR